MYKDISLGFIKYRVFENGVPKEDLMWHRDEKNRIIIPLCKNDWKIQLDNDLPHPLRAKLIKKDTWHRVFLGNGRLKLLIIEF